MSLQQKNQKEESEPYSSVGHEVERLDGREKVDGTVEYADDLEFSDLRFVELHRSTCPHGKIVDIDTSAAETMSGVECVVTREDVYRLQDEIDYDPFYGPAIKDQSVLALEKAHYVGEPIAAVIAESSTVAEQAVDRIDVEYDRYDTALDVEEALEDDAPILHEKFESADTFPDLEHVESGRETNQAFEFNLRRGDTDQALEKADHVFENTYRTPPVQHMPLEPFVTIARQEGDGQLRLWTPNQSPHFVRRELAAMFRIPESQVRVEVPQVGGSYGLKLYVKTEALLSLCAYISDHTVKLQQTVDESFVTATRHETKVTLRTGVSQDGELVGRKADVYYDTGAYAEIGPRITKKSGYTASGPYEIENVSIDSHCVYTNKPPAVAFRGFGVPQLVTAYEAQMDMIADELGMDPVKLREKNGFREGSTHPTGSTVESVGLLDCLDEVADAVDWDESLDQPEEPHVKRGRGIACGYKACITPSTSGVLIVMHGDGSATIHSSSVEIGQGVNTTLAQILSESLSIPLDEVSVSQPDTDTSPFDTITAGSRSTFHMGNAVVEAAADLKDQLFDIVADTWDVDPSDVNIDDGAVTNPDTGQEMTFGEVVRAEFGRAGGTLIGRGHYTTEGGKHDPETGQSDKPTVFWFFGASSAVVDFDTETGKVDVKELHNAADVGQAIDPQRCRDQIMGGAAHALGQTLSEEMVFEFGQQRNQTLGDYKIPSIEDMPENVSNHVVETTHEDGPFGAKGVGETGSFAVSPAIMNAMLDATGTQVNRIPLTPERVLETLEGGDL